MVTNGNMSNLPNLLWVIGYRDYQRLSDLHDSPSLKIAPLFDVSQGIQFRIGIDNDATVDEKQINCIMFQIRWENDSIRREVHHEMSGTRQQILEGRGHF